MSASQPPSWFGADAPTFAKITDLPDSTQPATNNIDCAPETFVLNGQGAAQSVCAFSSPLGMLTTDGRIFVAGNDVRTLYGPEISSHFLPSNDPGTAVLSMQSSGIGNYIGVYRNLTKASLQKYPSQDSGEYYAVPASPDAFVHNAATGERLQLDMAGMAFSANGRWMVADVPHQGLIRVDMTDLSVKLFSRPLEPEWYLSAADISLAVSNDGDYVAANTDIFGSGNVSVYDMATCTDQMNVVADLRQYCAGKDIWNGLTLNGQPDGQGVLAQLPSMVRPTHLRFVNDENISLTAEYSVASNTAYKVGDFMLTAPGAEDHRLGLLGMGDSYISGQGAFQYKAGTDTANNTCHLSSLSYPFILGGTYFNAYNSVACSGAVTGDLVQAVDTKATDKTYQGQVKDNIEEKNRDKASILSAFLPGYIYQQEFASTYLPQAIVMSIGGNDIGFADIVKQCAAHTDTCYDTYEDRAELVGKINATYSKLVKTYTTVRAQSGGARVYIVGYPQIAKPGGDCGLNVHLNADEVTFSSQLIDYLNSVIKQAADTVGVFYVDTAHALDGHMLCEAGEKAVNGLTAGGDSGVKILSKQINFIGAESYHPTQLGHQLLASTIADKTNNLAAPMPMPTAYSQPSLNDNAAMFQDVPRTGRAMNLVTSDGAMTGDVVFPGDAAQITVDGSDTQLQPGSQYQIILHSIPVTIGSGSVDTSGNINASVTIPADTEPGYHVLHVYGINMAGQSVDIEKVIYVAPNSSGTCGPVADSGTDSDHDGVDDACDPMIIAPPVSAKTNTPPSAENNSGLQVGMSIGQSGLQGAAQISPSSLGGVAMTATGHAAKAYAGPKQLPSRDIAKIDSVPYIIATGLFSGVLTLAVEWRGRSS